MDHPHSVVFLGTSAFAVPALQALASDNRFRVEHVVTQPDKPVGRKQILTAPPVKIAAEKLGIQVLQPASMNREIEVLKKLKRPDYLVVVSYGQILNNEVLAWPTIAPVNVHASLLPVLRGASPLQHAILQGHPMSGVTVQRIVAELDAGPILGQSEITLQERETIQTLHDRLAVLGASLLISTLTKPLVETEQDHAKKTLCRKLSKADGTADPSLMDAVTIDRMVRALTPWPGVQWKECKILETTLSENVHGFPLTCAGKTVLYITKIQPAGGKPMDGASFLRGHPTLLQ